MNTILSDKQLLIHPTVEYNKLLCSIYPFLFCGSNRDKDDSYTYTWQDDIPVGWRIAFCPGIWEDFKTAILADIEKSLVSEYPDETARKEKAKNLYDTQIEDYFSFVQIKEKYGTLRLYHTGGAATLEVEYKYDALSENICIECGAPAEVLSLGWISPYCQKCVDQLNSDRNWKIKTIPLSEK